MKEATSTIAVLSLYSLQVGQETLFTSSSRVRLKYCLILSIIRSLVARVAGLEPTANGFGDRYSTN